VSGRSRARGHGPNVAQGAASWTASSSPARASHSR
jgi:hypothetical protein